MNQQDTSRLFQGPHALEAFAKWVRSSSCSRMEVLVDQHTLQWCLPRFEEITGLVVSPLVVPAGEGSKSVDVLTGLWQALLDRKADRDTLLVNLGGGVITDLGGFVASTYKRGIPFAHIPTSLLGQVDAAIGGKTGIDFGHIKNSVGTFAHASALVLDTGFLSTLPADERRSGMAEVFKHGLIRDAVLWKALSEGYRGEVPDAAIVDQAAVIKMDVVRQDPLERGLRKILNFGHTVGHVVESASLIAGAPVRHGDAVAAGILMEGWISYQLEGLPSDEWEEIRSVMTRLYPPLPLQELDQESMIGFLRHDKKNRGDTIRMVLLPRIGEASYDRQVDEEMVVRALESYAGFYSS